jgi:hypothetical protein
MAHAVASHPEGYLIRSIGDVERQVQQTEQQTNRWGLEEVPETSVPNTSSEAFHVYSTLRLEKSALASPG